MAKGAGVSSGIKTKVYALLGTTAVTDAVKGYTSEADIATNVATTANHVGTATLVGDIAKEANTLSYGVYGEDSDRKLAGQSSLGDFELGVALDRSLDGDASPAKLQDADVGDPIVVALHTVTKSGDNETMDYIVGEIAGTTVSRPLDGPPIVTMTIAMTKAPKAYDHA